jgi:CNT family concentrative nucleoside transporter
MFFVAFVEMMYYLGVMQSIIKKFAWFFYKTMNASGAEAVVAAASPWVGPGENAVLVKPYVDLMTESERACVPSSAGDSSDFVAVHLAMTSGFSTIAGAVMATYIALGAGAQNLVTSSVMSIPASIAISKMRVPETDTPVTLGRVIVDRGDEDEKTRSVNAIHAFTKGAISGLVITGQILCVSSRRTL